MGWDDAAVQWDASGPVAAAAAAAADAAAVPTCWQQQWAVALRAERGVTYLLACMAEAQPKQPFFEASATP